MTSNGKSLFVIVFIIILSCSTSDNKVVCDNFEYSSPDIYLYKSQTLNVDSIITMPVDNELIEEVNIIKNNIGCDSLSNLKAYQIAQKTVFQVGLHGRCRSYRVIGCRLNNETVIKLLPIKFDVSFCYNRIINDSTFSLLATINDSQYYNRSIFTFFSNQNKVEWTMFEDDSELPVSWVQNVIIGDTSSYR